MLAPGEALLNPAPLDRKTPPNGGVQLTTPPAPRVEAKEPEPRSFLLTLLRALGAVHT